MLGFRESGRTGGTPRRLISKRPQGFDHQSSKESFLDRLASLLVPSKLGKFLAQQCADIVFVLRSARLILFQSIHKLQWTNCSLEADNALPDRIAVIPTETFA